MEWWGWLLAVAGGLATISSGIKAVKDILRPAILLSERVKEMERHDKLDMVRFQKIDEMFARQDRMNQALLKGMIALMNHAANGNSIESLKRASIEMTNFIIEN